MEPRPSKPPTPIARRIVSFLVTVVVLAGVIYGVSALASRDRSEPPGAATDAATSSELAMSRAREALRAGDTTAAVAVLEEAARLDPDNTAVKKALDEARKASDAAKEPVAPSPDPEAPDDTLKPDDPGFLTEIDDLVSLLPPEVPGFFLGAASDSVADATVSGTPNTGSGTASRALWTVHDRKNARDAAAFLGAVSRSLYPEDGAEIVVDGTKAYFGTDGERFATVAYVRGRYAFEVVLTSISGDPARLRVEAVDAAKSFPDAP